jgi:predicted permease
MHHLRLGFRTLLRTPFVSVVATLSLALGIGANAAIFSLFNQLLLRPLPVERPGELVNLKAPGPKPGNTSCNQAGACDEVFSYPMFRDLEQAQTVFTGLAAHVSFGANLAARGVTLNGEGMLVSGSYFPVLGIKPGLGRLFAAEDMQSAGEPHSAVLSHEFWQTRFAADPDIVGQPLTVNGQVLTIVGVTPPGFDGTTLGVQPRVFVPITLRELVQPNLSRLADRRAYWAYLFARLKPGATIEQARIALNVPYRAILNDVEAPLQKGMSDQTLSRFKDRSIEVWPGARGQSSLSRQAGTPLLLLLGVTAIVLLIACANIANLLLARAAARSSELAIRLSLGAGRRHLVGQLLTESSLLAAVGGLAGVLIAGWTLDVMVAMLPAEATSFIETTLDRSVLLFAAALTVSTAALFGLYPALHATRSDLIGSIKSQAGQSSGARVAARFRAVLATGQTALAMTLLVAAGLFIRSLANVSRVELGLNPEQVLTFAVSPGLNGYTPERSRQVFERLEAALQSYPGVTGVTAARVPLLAGSNSGRSVRVEGFDAGPDTDTESRFNEVGTAYLATMGIPLLAGREFTSSDALDTPKVAIVNQTFAKKFNLGEQVVGKRMSPNGPRSLLDVEIVGLAADAKYSEVKGEVPALFVLPYKQSPQVGRMFFYARTAVAPESLLASVPKLVADVDPNLPVENLRTLPQQVRQNVFLDRFISILSTAFAVLATLLAATGLYGVLAYTVAQRTREIGVRMALGAAPGRIKRMVLEQVGKMTLVGGAIGLVLAVVVGRLAASLLYQLEGYDPVVLGASAVALAAVALAAALIPAHRASRIEPIRALRWE